MIKILREGNWITVTDPKFLVKDGDVIKVGRKYKKIVLHKGK